MTRAPKTARTRYHYWLVATDPETGKPYLIYGGIDEEATRQKGLEMLSGIDFAIKRLPTSDLGRASSMIKGIKLEKTHSLKQASRYLGHSKSLKRLRRKRLENHW